METIFLSDTCSVEVHHLPCELKKMGKDNFDAMFALCPNERHTVFVRNHEVETSRYQKSYLSTPKISDLPVTLEGGKKMYAHSYMFSSEDDSNNNEDLPEIFQPYLDFVKAKFKDCNFNQVSVNWYNDGNDYIAFHKDCEHGMAGNKNICIITFNESDEDPEIRNLTFKKTARTCSEKPDEVFRDNIDIPLHHGSIVMLNSHTQRYYKHGIKRSNATSKRISISFRQF